MKNTSRTMKYCEPFSADCSVNGRQIPPEFDTFSQKLALLSTENNNNVQMTKEANCKDCFPLQSFCFWCKTLLTIFLTTKRTSMRHRIIRSSLIIQQWGQRRTKRIDQEGFAMRTMKSIFFVTTQDQII